MANPPAHVRCNSINVCRLTFALFLVSFAACGTGRQLKFIWYAMHVVGFESGIQRFAPYGMTLIKTNDHDDVNATCPAVRAKAVHDA